MKTKLIFERSKEGRIGYIFPKLDIKQKNINSVIDEKYLRKSTFELPEVSEVDVIRHYVDLSRRNYGVDLGFYPLGSCTMKYNPKINEQVARFSGFTDVHPLQPEETTQGFLKLMHTTLKYLCEITGMKWGTLQPYAGAHGEYTGMKFFKSYFRDRGETNRKIILVPDSAHGTNPASAHISGFKVVEIKSNSKGLVDIEEVKKYLNEELAGIMLTNPNTLGLFEEEIIEIAKLVHDAGGLLYYDGANLNAIMGKIRPGDMGFDAVHLNLHKTFSTPHGGGGPGSGPVLVNEKLLPYLPVPDIKEENGKYSLNYDIPKSMGKIAGFYGNIGVIVKALAYILTMGRDGLKKASEIAVLNANYIKEHLKEFYYLPHDRICKHEFVFSGSKIKEKYGVSTLDIAKRLLDYGVHPPTIYFPLIVHEAIMIEPTETESKESLDNFIDIMKKIFEEIKTNPEIVKNAPHNTIIKRVDEVKAAKHPILKWEKDVAN